MKKAAYILFSFICCISLCTMTACTSKTESAESMEAPEIGLTDPLSSLLSEFRVRSGNYELNTQEGKRGVQGVIACGMHPLDENVKKQEVLVIPDYNGMDEVVYQMTCETEPDMVTIKEWDVSDIGNTESEPENCKTYEETFLLELKHGKVYEIILFWAEDKAEENGYYGEASYVVVTE